MNIAPGATYEAVLESGITGLVGTIKLGVIDNQGAVTSALATTTIIETPAGSGIYAATRTAPAVAGTYTLVWSLDGTTDPDQVATDELIVTYSAPEIVAGTLYVTRDELKASVSIDGSYADDEIDLACEAASRVIDAATGRRFYTDTTTRYFTGDRYSPDLTIGDIGSVTAVTVDNDGNGSYETTWVQGTDFILDPPNAVANGTPYRTLRLLRQAGRVFPIYEPSVKVEGTFGWAAIPPEVRQYAKLLAVQLLMRPKQAPFGIVGIGETATRIGRYDPDFQRLLGHLVKTRLFV